MTKKRVTVLGAGLVGRPMALDLKNNNEFDVKVADFSAEALNRLSGTGIATLKADLTDTNAVKNAVADADFVLNAVPGSIGYQSLRSVIEAGKNCVDIAFYDGDPIALNDLALEKNVCVICDMGVAPGMSHLLSGYASSKLKETTKILIYVGGLPKIRTYPWEYKAVFSPSDVIEEYTRPARLVENGKIVVKEALSESELIDFESIGTLEAFNSDGLRSLVYTLKADYMAEKTLRYVGHIDKIKMMKKAGFFDNQAIQLGNQSVVPIEFTKKLLFSDWKLNEGEEDITVMRVQVEGRDENGQEKQFVWDLFDAYDTTTQIHSMARTTGYTATAALRLMQSGLFVKAGVHVPENLGTDEKCVQFILSQLAERGIVYNRR